MRISVATTVLPGLDHVGPLERAQTEVTVVRRATDLAELLAAARSGFVDGVLVVGGADLLSRGFLEEITRAPRPVGVLALSEVRQDRERIRALGVPCLRADTPPLELARALQDVARAAGQGSPPALGLDEEEPGEDWDLVASSRTADADTDADAEFAVVDAGVGAGSAWTVAATAFDPAGHTPPRSPREVRPAVGAGDTDADGEDATAGLPVISRPRGDGSEGSDDAPGAPATPDAPGMPAAPAVSAVPAAPAAPPEDPVEDSDSALVEEEGGVSGGAATPEPGRVIAVWGPTGAPGRTTVAVNLAAETAAAHLRTLLVDLDTYGPSVGVHLGLTEESAGVSRAAHRADRGRLTPGDIAQSAVRVRVAGAPLDVLTGLTRPDRWTEVRPAAVQHILEVAREGWDRVVVDVGFNLEEDEELSFDVPAPQRNGAAATTVVAADRILAVGGPDAVALPRLLRALDSLPAAVDPARVEVVMNRVRAAAAGVSPRSQVEAVWARYGPDIPIVAHLPWDPQSADRALLGGQVLAEASASGRLRRAIVALARTDPGVAARVAPSGGERRGSRPTSVSASPAPPRRRLLPWLAPSPRTP